MQMKRLLLLLLLTSSLFAESYWDKDDDKPYFQQRDNLAHIGVATLASYLISDYVIRYHSFTKTEAWFMGFVSSILIGTIKEMTDKNFDIDDLSGYAVGGAVGSSIVIYRF